MAGAGAGVAFGEYSSLRYEELPISGFDQAITASETVEVGEEGDVFVSTVYGGGCSSEIVADESVAPNTLVINAQCSGLADGIVISKPRVSVYEEEVYREDSPAKLSRLEERVTTDISVHPEVYYQDGFSEFMRNKDVILEGLKQRVRRLSRRGACQPCRSRSRVYVAEALLLGSFSALGDSPGAFAIMGRIGIVRPRPRRSKGAEIPVCAAEDICCFRDGACSFPRTRGDRRLAWRKRKSALLRPRSTMR